MIDRERVLGAWDLAEAPAPAYIIHETLLRDNLATIDRVRRAAGVEIIMALKANATWPIFQIIREFCDGATASSLSEARLVREYFSGKCHTYAPVYTEEEFSFILALSSHITFNSVGQYLRFGERARREGVSCGLRINPEHSTVATSLYNSATPQSRLGVRACDLQELPEGIEGLHFHSLCESRPEDLEATLLAVEERFGRYLDSVKWINIGGGHLMTHEAYDEELLIAILLDFKQRHPNLRVILEPGSAFTWDTGVLVARVEDVVCNGGRNTLMLNVSFACHMPDCLEMPYKPAIVGMHDSKAGDVEWWMGGNSCLAGDTMGSWVFDDGRIPQIGDRVIFRDMIHYTMVKTTMFNGVTHPSIVLYSEDGGFKLLRSFGYEDYKCRMG